MRLPAARIDGSQFTSRASVGSSTTPLSNGGFALVHDVAGASFYDRNEVVRALTPGAVPWKAIVEEAWPSAEHVTDPFLFYTASNQDELNENLAIMLESVGKLTDLATLRVNTMSEYLLRSF